MRYFMMILLIASSVHAQYWYDDTEGLSVAAMGRGGAGIAVGGDPAGIWHNPAGLAQIQQTAVDVAVDYWAGDERYDQLEEIHLSYGGPPDDIGRYQTKNDTADGDWYGLAYVSAVKPVSIAGRTLALQAGFRRLASFPDFEGSWTQITEREFDGTIEEHWEEDRAWKRDTHGGIEDWGMACAIEVVRGLSLGLNLHFMNADYGAVSVSDGRQDYPSPFRTTDDYAFSGLLWDLGFWTQIHPSLSVGGIYRSGLDAGMDYRRTAGWPDEADEEFLEVRGHTGVHWPDGYGFGMSWTPSPAWLMVLDYSRMNWSKGAMDKLIGFYAWDYEDIGFPTLFYSQWDTDAWRFGIEYRHPGTGPIRWIMRAGYYRQEQMVNQAAGWGVPADQPTYGGYTLGAGLAAGRIRWDIAVIHVRGEEDAAWTEVGGDILVYYANSQKTHSTRIALSGTVMLD